MIARLHTFPDAWIPRGIPETSAPPSKVCGDALCRADPTEGAGSGGAMNCQQYATAWPMHDVNPQGMIDAAANHPQFAFYAGGPGTVYQIGVESQLRRLDQPLSNCQAVIAEDAPLYRNTVLPPVGYCLDERVQNAANPISNMIRGPDPCRSAADEVASAMSGRRFYNPTREDTKRFDLPFGPPGIGAGEARPRRQPSALPYFS